MDSKSKSLTILEQLVPSKTVHWTSLENAQIRQTITLVLTKQKTKSCIGDVVQMIRHTTMTFIFSSDEEHKLQTKLRIIETQTSNLIGVEICPQNFSKQHFELPAIELKIIHNAVCYGNLCATQSHPFVSKVNTIRVPHHIHMDAKIFRVWNGRR